MTDRDGEFGGGGDDSPDGGADRDGDRGGGGAGGAVGKVAGGASDVLGGVSVALGDGEDTKAARAALETAAGIAGGVKKGAETAEQIGNAAGAIRGGDAGGAAGSIGGALGGAGAGVGGLASTIGGLVPDGEARRGLQEVSRVASTVGQVARGVGQIVEGVADLLGELGGAHTDVVFHLEIDGEDIPWVVQSISYHDAIGQLTDCSIQARCPLSPHVDEEDLLGKDAHLTMERGDEQRSIRGLVQHAHVSQQSETLDVRFDVSPGMWLLTQTLDSRIYQDISVPDLVEKIFNELLSSRQRTVRQELTETYTKHEYLVQHRESHYEFIARLCDEEGIFFYFDHDGGDHEILVLADSNDNRPRIRESHEGRVDYEQNENRAAGRDVAYGIDRRRSIGPTDAVVKGFDWTNPSLDVKHERTERGSWNGPPLEVYDHHHAVRHHEYDDGGGQYRSHAADRRSRLHTERLDIRRQAWTVESSVVTAKPGHTFELVGTDDHDERYLILSVAGTGTAGKHGGVIHNALQVIPVSMPYRPPAPARRVMPGPETAIVVGPPGEEIHTDLHGRIKVQFHWDRQGQRDEHSSAWLRVSQAWAGPGWGTIFIPRIGMEVIVSFLGGDPDRPIVTGCVYNGTNNVPYPLPDNKTRSTIKTNSSLGGGGYNELRFEDKAGSEEVWIHAQKDFNEVVENNHTTRVKNCQTNTVDVDQTETIRRDQTMNVKRDRVKTIEGMEMTTVIGQRHEVVNSEEFVTIDLNRSHTVHASDNLKVVENRNTTIDGQYNIKTHDHYKILQNSINEFTIKDSMYAAMVGRIQLKAGNGAVHYDACPDGLLKVKSKGETHLLAKQDMFLKSEGTVTIQANGAIVLMVGTSSITIDSETITLAAATVTVEGGNLVDIKCGGQVKIKC